MGGIFRKKPLFERLSAAGEPELLELCRRHKAEIVAEFPNWRRVPEALRSNPQAVQERGRVLMAVAQALVGLGDSSLLNSLSPAGPRPDPAHMHGLRQAKQLAQQFRFVEGAQLLEKILAQSSGDPAEWVLAPHLLATLAECRMQSGQPLAACAEPLQRALDVCQKRQDAEGLLVYSRTAYELFRYHGEHAAARAMALQLAELGSLNTDTGRYYRSQLRVLETPEPLLRVQVMLGQSCYEVEDVPVPFSGRVQLVMQRNRPTLQACEARTRAGKELGGQGRLEEALAAFQEAAQLDPHCPDCHFQAGYTLLKLKRYAEAAEECRQADRLAPGWFSCRLDAWLAERLGEGRLTHSTWDYLNQLQDGGLDPATRLRIAEELDREAGWMGFYHLLKGRALQDLDRRQEAEAAYRQGLACESEEEVRTSLLAALAIVCQDPEERWSLFEQAWKLNGHLVSAASARLALRSKDAPPQMDPNQLRQALFTSLASGRRAETVDLCRQHHEAVWTNWAPWVMQLMMLQSQPDQAKAYSASLRALAEVYAQELNDPRMMRAFGA